MAMKYERIAADRIKNHKKYEEEEKEQQYVEALKNRGFVNPNATTTTAYSIISNEVERLRAIRKQNAATNLNQTAKNAMNRMVMGGFNPVQEAPATNKLKKGVYTDIQNKLNSQIENELHIVNDQGRDKDDPAVLRAQETLQELGKKKADTQKKLSGIQEPLYGKNEKNRFEPKITYSPETNKYISRIQGMNAGLAKRMTQKQDIPSVWDKKLADWQHMINTPESTDSEDYVKWLEEGRRIGQYGDRELNAMLRGVGQADPAKVYAGMDDSEKSSYFNLKDQDMLNWENAMKWLAEHPEGADASALRAKRQHYHDELADRYYNADEFWQDEREAAKNRLANLNGKWLSYTPEGERMPVNIMGRKGNYDTPEQMARMDEMLYDAVMGQGAYQNEISGYEGSTFRDQHMRELNERISRAWDAYENENPYMEGSRDELFDILTGRDAAHDAERVNTLESERRYLEDQIKELDGRLSYYDQRNKYLEGYKEWNTANDTADDTQYDKGKYNPYDYRFSLADKGSDNVDDIYSFIIGGNERRNYIEATSAGRGGATGKISKEYKGAMLLMPEEINIFKNMYEAGQKEEASAFLDGLQFAINQRYLPYEEIRTREEARAFPILNSIFAQGANVVNTVMGAANAIGSELEVAQGITNADEMGNDPASNAYAPVRYATTVQDEVASMLGPDAGKLYLNTMNTMRNVINGVLLTKMGIPAGALPTASLATFGTQIYQEKMYEHLQENRDFERANALSILDTALEVGEELLPIETMFATAGANVFVRVIANMLSEGGEELAGATAGEVLRGMITGRYAWEKRKDEIFNEGGYTDKDGNWVEVGKGDAGLAEAHKQAMREWGEQIVENTVAGAFGGGMGATYGAIQNYSENSKTGIQVNSKEGGFDTLLEAARGMDPESETKKIADDLYKKQQKGKNISNYQAGKLARIMYAESGERIQDIIKGAMTRQVEAELKEEGASPEYAEKAAPAIAEAVTTGRTPKKADIRVIAKEDAGLVLMESYLTGEKSAEESIKAAGGEAAIKAREAVRDVLGEKPAKVGPNKGDTARLRQFAPIAKQDELEAAEGPRHDNGLDAVVGGKVVSIKGRSGDNYIVVDENNNERTVSKNEVHAADERLGLVMEYADRNRHIIDDDTFQEIAFGLKDNKDMDLDDYLEQSTRAYIEYLTGGEVQNSQLAETTLSSLKAHAARMNDVLQEKGLVKPGKQQKVTPGKGTVTYNGIKAGTDEWQTMVKKAGPIKARELQLVAEIGVRLGNQFEIVEREDLPDSFGWEDKETGKIYINLAAKSSEDSRRNRSVTTIMAHELTHWLKQNSPEMYKELAQFVYKGLRESNENIVDSVYKKIGNEQAAVKRTISIADALDEIVADACDQVLTNEQTIRQLENESPNLYQKIKTFVRNFIDTVMGYTRNSKGEVITDTSRASYKIRKLGQEFENELTRKWLATRAEALGRQEGNPAEAEAQEGTGEVRMSTRERTDGIDITDAINNKGKYKQYFTYDNLIKKAPVKIVDIGAENNNKTRADAVENAINNVKKYGVTKNGEAFVHIDDTNSDVIVNKNSVRHSLDRRTSQTLMEHIGDLLKDSFVVNISDGREPGQTAAYHLVSVARNDRGLVYVCFNVNRYTHSLDSVDVLYSSRQKKEAAGRGPSGLANKGVTLTASTISISDVFEAVKTGFANVLPLDVMNKLKEPRRITKDTQYLRYSTREAEDQGIKDLEKALAHPHVKFSMREPVEATKDGLVAVHNMHMPELMGTLEEGGFTAPSIAVILARMGHSKYGNVSIVFKPSAIDPKQSRKNMVYGADAYTPERAHARVEQEIVTQEVNKAIKYIKGLLEGMDGNFTHEAENWFNQYLYDDDTYYTLNEIANTGYTNIGMLAAYQESKGNKVEPIFVEVPTSQAKAENEQDYGKLIDGLFDRGLYEEFLNDYEKAKAHDGFTPKELREKYGSIFKDILKETNKRWEIIKLDNPGMMEVIFTSNWFNEFYDYNKKGITSKKTFDEYKTRKELQAKTDENEFAEWLSGVIENTLGQKGIRNDKDPFTAVGNRRSFKALHDEYTAENVVRAMYKNAQQKGEGADFFQGLMATASKEYKNLAEVRADAGRLEMLDQEEYDAYIEQKSKEMNELAEDIAPSYPRAAREALLEAGKRYARNQSPEAVKRAFAAEGYNLTNEQLNKALDLIKEAREFKTGYFEAKPERVMGFDEIARVILPESTKNEPLYRPVLDMLDERGIPYDTYDGTDEDRLAKLNSVENVQFSTREQDQEYMDAVDSGDMDKAQQMVDRAAEAAGYTIRGDHGTVSKYFTIFDRKYGNAEGDWGKGFYFTNNQDDVETNYASEEGADLTAKIELLAEQMEWMDEYEGMDEDERREAARQQLAGGEPRVIHGALRMINPVNVGGPEETFFDYNEEYDEENDEYGEPEGSLIDFIEALNDVLSEYEYANVDTSTLYTEGMDYGGLRASDLEKLAKELVMDVTDEDGKLAGNEIVREAFERAGFDGIVDNTVAQKFGSRSGRRNAMVGVDTGTTHYIVFQPEQIKQTDPVTYDDAGNVIPLSKRFNTENQDIRYSTREMDSQYMRAVNSRDRATEQLMVDAQAIKSGFTTEDAFHGTAAFGFNSFDMEASGGAIFVAFSPKIAGTYVDNGEVRMIGKKYPDIGLDIMSAEQLAEELQEYYRNLPKTYGYETANEWTVKGIDKDDYVDFVYDYAENMKKLAAGKSFEKELSKLVDKMVALAHTGDEKAAYQVGVDMQRKFKTADYFGQDELENRRLELSAMMIPALAKGEDVININMHGINYYLSRSDVIRQLEKYSQDQEGIYRFYTRPGNQLLIDAKGANWNKIWIEDEQLRNDMWTYFNQKEALEEAQGINTYSKDMFTVTTRQISEYARYKKYSSVRINDVYDHGGRGDWDRERGHGDIAMFFNPNDVKSADPVTYDDNGKVVPLHKRFTDNADLRFSTREADLEVNRWMLGLSESSLRTTQERMLWKQYKEVNGSWELTKRFIRELNDRLKGLEAKENKTAKDTFDIQNLQKQIEKWEKKRDEYEEQILKVTADEGYAAIMYRERNKMENLLNGRTEDEVRAAIDAIQAEMETVEREMAERNAKLKELAERENVKIIRNQLNSAGLRKIAAKLKENLGSELQNKEIENRLALLALKMKQGKVDSSEIMELADMLVGSMRPAYDDYVLSELHGMTIALNDAEIKELKNRGMTVRDLQRELTGTGIRVTAGGPNTIDKNWDELTATFPQLDREANPGDMLYGPDADHKGLMDLVEDAIRQQKAMGPDSDQVAAMVLEAVSDLVPEVLTDARSMKLIRESMEFIAEINQGTEALDNINALFDRLKKKNAHAKATLGTLENKIVDAIEYTNELAKQHDVTAWKRERQALVDQLRSEHTQKLLEEQTKYREKIERYKKAQELNADNQAARREIHMNINRMRRLLVNETDSKNIPEHMKSLAREMVGMVLKSDQLYDRKITAIKPKDRADALRMIQAWDERDGKFTLNDLQQIPDEEVQDVIENALADIEEGIESYTAPAGRNLIENLTNYKKALVQIQDAVEKITNIIEAEQTAVIDGQKRKISHLAYGVVADLDKSKRKGEWTGFGSKALTAAQRSVIYGNTTPVYFMKNLRNRGMNVLWNGFESAENRKGLLAEAARKHMQELAEKYHYASWQHDKNIDVILNGVKVPMKLENIMALYATWTREQQMGPEVSQHMAQGGVYIEDEQENKGAPRREKKTQRARRVKEEDIARIENLLTQEQKDYIRDVVEYLSKDMSELGNEASMAMYGIRKYNEKYYFPMKVWDGVKSARSDKGISGTQENRIAHQGWSKRRKHLARNALIIGKFTDTAVQHIDEMTNYVTFAPVIEGLNKVLNWQEEQLDEDEVVNRRNLRVMFQEAYGKEALRYLEDWMKDLQGGVTQDQRKTLRDRLISMFKKNAVAGSLSVTLQQPLSYIRAAMLINPKYLAGALSPQYWKGSYQEMLDHSGVAVIKKMGRFDMNFGQSTRDWITPKTGKTVYERFSDALTKAPEIADTMTWTRMWSAVKMEQHAQHPDMDIKSDDFLNLVGKRFNEVMRRTQVYDSTLTKSSNMRSQALSMKLITSFMAEPTLTLNVLADAVMNVKQKGGKATLAKAGATYLLSAVLQAAVKGFMGAGRSPDEKKTAEENLLNKILYNLMSEANPASLIPGYSDLVEVLKNGELKDDALGVLGKLKSIYTTAQNMLNPEKAKGPWRDVEDTLGQFVQLFSNIPLKNIMRDTRAMYNWATGRKFADRETSGAVLRYQAEETRNNGDNLIGIINSWLGDAGYKSSNKAYYSRMYNAMSGGNEAEAEGIREYLELAKGQDAKKIDAGLRTAAREDESKTPAETSQWMIDNDLLDGTSQITTQFKNGDITAEEYKKLAMAANQNLTENDVWWTVDKYTWEQENGEAHSDYYYRLGPALETNKSAEITETIKLLLEHGRTKENIKTQLTKELKPLYLAADSAGKVKIRNELQLAYKALGLTAADADKIIKGWK